MDTNPYLVRRILRGHIAVTILVTLTATLSMVINGLIVGNMLGPDDLTAFGLASPVLIIVAAIAGIFSNGGTIVCAKYIGRGESSKVANNFTIVMMWSLLTGIIYTIVFFFCADAFADLFGASPEISDKTASYIKGLSISGIPFLLAQNMLLYMRMDGSQKLSLISMATIVVINTLAAVFIVKNTDMGLYGIGIAVALSNVAGIAVCCLHFLKKNKMLRFSKPKDSKIELKEICKAGLPTAINRGAQTFKNFFLNAFLMSFAGSAAVLALSVQTNVYQFLIAISTGYGIMIAMMCSLFYGERDKRSLSDSLRSCLISGFIVSLIAGILLFVFADAVAVLFIKGNGDVGMAAECLRYFALSQPTSTVCLIFLYLYQSLGNFLLSTVISLTRGIGYVLLFSFALTPIIGLAGTWISFFLADILSLLTIAAVLWYKAKHFPRKLEDLLMLKDDEFEVNLACDVSIRNDIGEVMGLADRMSEMIRDRNIPTEKIHRISLCIEEMAGNVIQHAFDDKKEHYIDIRVIIKDEDVIFRMRDDGRMFNPLNERSEDHLGIRTVRAVAKNIDYRYSFGLNNLRVTV